MLVQNVRDFSQSKLDSEINAPFLLNKHGDLYFLLHIPNRTFLVRFGGISGEFGRAMVRLAKIAMARPNEPDMPPKRTKKVRLGIYRTQIQPKI